MPEIGAVETFKKIKEITPDTSVIVVTAYVREELIREATTEGSLRLPQETAGF